MRIVDDFGLSVNLRGIAIGVAVVALLGVLGLVQLFGVGP